jgi:hypothetical protein
MPDYHRRRLAEEVALAASAASEFARSAHLELAELHLDRLTALEAAAHDETQPTPQQPRIQAI